MAENDPMKTEQYLASFNYGRDISLGDLWREMDRVWDQCGLDNRKRIDEKDLARYYAHPVWVLNGLFAEQDADSIAHREAIAGFIQTFFGRESLTIADFGGGAGVLANVIAQRVENVGRVDIVEPWPSDYFRQRYVDNQTINFVSAFRGTGYDVVVAQDVLEHVDNPVDTAIACIEATRIGGSVIFANCFYPVIKCHLPITFYLRHTFNYVMSSKELPYKGVVKGAGYARVFEKQSPVDSERLKRRMRVARVIGPVFNAAGAVWAVIRKRGPRAGS